MRVYPIRVCPVRVYPSSHVFLHSVILCFFTVSPHRIAYNRTAQNQVHRHAKPIKSPKIAVLWACRGFALYPSHYASHRQCGVINSNQNPQAPATIAAMLIRHAPTIAPVYRRPCSRKATRVTIKPSNAKKA